MKVRLTCNSYQYEMLCLAADKGRSKHVAVLRHALKALLLDHNRLRHAADRFVDVIDPSPAERAVMMEGRE